MALVDKAVVAIVQVGHIGNASKVLHGGGLVVIRVPWDSLLHGRFGREDQRLLLSVGRD